MTTELQQPPGTHQAPPDITRARCKPPCGAEIYQRADRPGSWLHVDSDDSFFCPHDTPEPAEDPAEYLTKAELIEQLRDLPDTTRILSCGGQPGLRDARVMRADDDGVIITGAGN